MSTLISCATGNWLDASTWKLCSALSGAELDSEAYNTGLTVTYAYSSSFTTSGTLEIDGIAVRIYSRNASPSGTITVCIGQAGSPVTGTEVTIDVADIDDTDTTPSTICNQSYGWYFFKFASPVTLSAGTAYTVGAKTSSTSQVNLYRDSTTTNWSRLIRTTTTQAPAAGDKLFVLGEHTGQGTGNNLTVTMNNTDTTDYGTGSTALASLGIGKRGTLSFGYAASTNYNLRLSGLLWIYSGGTLNVGTVANPIPSTGSAKIEFDCAAAGDFGLIKGNGGVLVMQGNALSYDRAKLASDITTTDDHFHTDVSTGWKSGDTVVIASTSRTYSEYEIKTLNGDASGTTVNITGTFSYAHAGTAPRIADVIHFNRNVNITVVSGKEAYNAYIQLYGFGSGSIDIDWVGFSELGNTATGNKYSLYYQGTDETINIQYCSFLYCWEVYFNSSNNFVLSNCVFCPHTSMNNAYNGTALWIAGPTVLTQTNWTVSNIMAIGGTPGSATPFMLYITMPIGTISNLTASSNQGIGMVLQQANIATGAMSSVTIYSCGTYGLYTSTTFGRLTVTDLTIWCCTPGIGSGIVVAGGLIFNNAVLYGNSISVAIGGSQSHIEFNGGSSHGLTGYATTYHFQMNNVYYDFNVRDMNLGGTAEGKIDISNQGIYLADVGDGYMRFHNCTWGASTRYYITSGWQSGQNRCVYIAFSKDNGTEGNDWAIGHNGFYYHDTTNGIGSTDCLKLVPSKASYYFDTSLVLDHASMFQCPAQDGVQRTVYISAKDDASFNGTDVDISLWMNGTKVVDWTAIDGTLTTTYNEYSLQYTPTEDGVLELAIRLNGTAGAIYLDGFRWT